MSSRRADDRRAGRRSVVPAYVSLLTYTEQGLKGIKEAPQRVKMQRERVQQAGGKLIAIWWTQGQYDAVAITEFPDDDTAMAILFALGGQGNVRSQTLRAFSEDDLGRILGKLPG
jgi:uncharacterized protein with GYD domain